MFRIDPFYASYKSNNSNKDYQIRDATSNTIKQLSTVYLQVLDKCLLFSEFRIILV